MGWAIKRPDGTYRCWNANAQDDTLQAGEVWESLTTQPVSMLQPIISPPPPPNPLKARIDAVLASTTISPELRALLATWKTQL